MPGLTPAQARLIETVRGSRVELRQSRRDGTYYWEADGKRLAAPSGRVLDRLAEAGVILTRREDVRVVGMNVPRKAVIAYVA